MHRMLPDCPELRNLIHRDLLNRNVLVSPDASRLEAVYDWGCSVAADFLYEAAWFTFWSAWYPALQALNPRRLFQEHFARLGVKTEDFHRRMSCYELHIGLEHIAYSAFTGSQTDLFDVARRTKQVLEAAGSPAASPG